MNVLACFFACDFLVDLCVSAHKWFMICAQQLGRCFQGIKWYPTSKRMLTIPQFCDSARICLSPGGAFVSFCHVHQKCSLKIKGKYNVKEHKFTSPRSPTMTKKVTKQKDKPMTQKNVTRILTQPPPDRERKRWLVSLGIFGFPSVVETCFDLFSTFFFYVAPPGNLPDGFNFPPGSVVGGSGGCLLDPLRSSKRSPIAVSPLLRALLQTGRGAGTPHHVTRGPARIEHWSTRPACGSGQLLCAGWLFPKRWWW